MLFLALGFALLVAYAHCKPLNRWDDVAEKHSWIEIPKGWEYKAPAPHDYPFDLKIGMKQHRFDELLANLMEISDPNHVRYTEHLTKEQVEEFTAPHPDSIRLLDEWLLFHGIDPNDASVSRSKGGDWITLLGVTVEQAESLLGTKYNIYEHGPSGDQVVRTLGYSLPKDLHRHVDVVAPTTYFGTTRSMAATSFLKPKTPLKDVLDSTSRIPPAGCGKEVTPECLRWLYKTKDYVPKAKMVNTIGVAGYLNQYANYADLQTFFDVFRRDAVGSNFTTILVHGGQDDQSNPGIEANLDVQYTTAISYPTPNIYYSIGGSPPFTPDSFTQLNTNEPYIDFLNYILDQSSVPQVLTTSYGDNEQTVPQDYAIRVCNDFATLGSRGTSVFFSSGDAGVGGGDCKTNNGTNQVIFQPVFPASCPFVTAVGGTTGVPEKATSFSGGGFSRYFSRQPYQDADVKAFLSRLGNTYEGLYNATGRAYPDVSAQSDNFLVVISGIVIPVGGTSASSPTVAGIFSLLNDLRLSKGKTSLGFLNPLIYSNKAKKRFNDITSGSNPGCGTEGFAAGVGWDPVTGLGTPDFSQLSHLV